MLAPLELNCKMFMHEKCKEDPKFVPASRIGFLFQIANSRNVMSNVFLSTQVQWLVAAVKVEVIIKKQSSF